MNRLQIEAESALRTAPDALMPRSPLQIGVGSVSHVPSLSELFHDDVPALIDFIGKHINTGGITGHTDKYLAGIALDHNLSEGNLRELISIERDYKSKMPTIIELLGDGNDFVRVRVVFEVREFLNDALEDAEVERTDHNTGESYSAAVYKPSLRAINKMVDSYPALSLQDVGATSSAIVKRLLKGVWAEEMVDNPLCMLAPSIWRETIDQMREDQKEDGYGVLTSDDRI